MEVHLHFEAAAGDHLSQGYAYTSSAGSGCGYTLRQQQLPNINYTCGGSGGEEGRAELGRRGSKNERFPYRKLLLSRQAASEAADEIKNVSLLGSIIVNVSL